MKMKKLSEVNRKELLKSFNTWELALCLDGEVILRGVEDHNTYCNIKTIVDSLRDESRINDLAALVNQLSEFKERINNHLEYILGS
jgi:hypothetical protein